MKRARPNLWNGNSGELFGEMVREELATQDLTAHIEITPVTMDGSLPPGAYLVHVFVIGGPDVLFNVVDWVDGVQVLDPNGEELTRVEALNYLRLRCAGSAPRDALRDC